MNIKTKKIIFSVISAIVFAAQATFAAGEPEDVKGLAATPIDSQSIGLTWDAAKDASGGLVDHYRIYYGTTSVFKAGGGTYDKEIETPNNNTSYVVTGLKGGTEYFFSITAIDADDKESAQYAPEVSATTPADPEKAGEDTTSPTVVSVSAPNQTEVQVVFSEKVQLPATQPEASFSIVEQIDSSKTLDVKSAAVKADDPTTVILETAPQTPNVNYIITAGISVKDLAGNPIISGSTDSGLFLGSSQTAENKDDQPGSETGDCKEDASCFVQLLANCSTGTFTQKDNEFEYSLKVTSEVENHCVVQYTANKHPNVLFAAATMECRIPKGSYENIEKYQEAFDITQCTGDLVSGYKAVEAKDTTPPEDVTNLMLTFKEQLEKYMVTLKWTASLNTAKDLVEQILYLSMDRGNTYNQVKSLGDTATSTEVDNLDGGKEYTFKITTKDAAGNESTGAIKSIRLPQTGVGVGLLLLGSAMAAREGLRRRKK